MVDYLAARTRLINGKGRDVVLRRQTVVSPPTYSDITAKAFVSSYRPEDIKDGLKQGDRRIEILPVATVPLTGDRVVADGQTWSVLGARALYAGAVLLGYSLTVRG